MLLFCNVNFHREPLVKSFAPVMKNLAFSGGWKNRFVSSRRIQIGRAG